MNWDVALRVFSYNGDTRGCDLCLMEKLAKANFEPYSLVNTYGEIIFHCRHMKKFTFKNFKISQ